MAKRKEKRVPEKNSTGVEPEPSLVASQVSTDTKILPDDVSLSKPLLNGAFFILLRLIRNLRTDKQYRVANRFRYVDNHHWHRMDHRSGPSHRP